MNPNTVTIYHIYIERERERVFEKDNAFTKSKCSQSTSLQLLKVFSWLGKIPNTQLPLRNWVVAVNIEFICVLTSQKSVFFMGFSALKCAGLVSRKRLLIYIQLLKLPLVYCCMSFSGFSERVFRFSNFILMSYNLATKV